MFVLLKQLSKIRRAERLELGDARWRAIRHIDAGSCNGCEHEFEMVTNPFHDLSRHGINVVPSPRHADILLITGPVTNRMLVPLMTAYNAMPEPRIVAALGDCALGCNLLGDPSEFTKLEDHLPIDIRIPGCPPTPDTIVKYLVEALRAQGTRNAA